MIEDLVCSECGSKMQEGYIPDFTRGTTRQSFWVEGAFEKDFWGFPKYKGKRHIVLQHIAVKISVPSSYLQKQKRKIR